MLSLLQQNINVYYDFKNKNIIKLFKPNRGH